MRAQALFFTLICCQAAHSVEEYLFGLYLDFPPAQVVSRLFSQDLQRGFVIANVLLLALGVGCFLGPVRRNWASARPVMWCWTVLEALNGVGHSARSLLAGHYTAGSLSALLLLGVALLLARQLIRQAEGSTSPVMT
jgi:hypothetical protein